MLILSRKSNESIIIGDNIRITVASIRGRYVRIGIEAPGNVTIFREELCTDPGTAPSQATRDIKHHDLANHKLRSVAGIGPARSTQ
jgi:carbon storage regulator